MQSFLTTVLLLFFCFDILGALGDVGSATSYGPPYLPTQCHGNDQGQFPSDGFFAAVSDGLWDNGAACDRRYQLRCISGPNRPCKGGVIIVKVVDHCRGNPCPAAMAMSTKAFNDISKFPNVKINIEYAQ
uniref:Expansin-like EG45 domain-containing protein n=1 Tax=Fagus sylvatica TaxID=28930 RepID=A0A2N9GZN5_FAGSY